MMVDSFIQKQKQEKDGYSTIQCLKMFGVSDSGYYAWKGRQSDRNGKQAEREKERDGLKEKMRQIVQARNGIIPGKRTFRLELFRRYGLTVNVKRIASLMKEMNLVAQKPHRDAYKHQASHDHVCAAPANAVCQDFFIGPRKVILTDITYLYYGKLRETFYLCVFRDAFTRENLGWECGRSMDTGLVKRAYSKMMKDHGSELKDGDVYVHSDQGSQYLSTSYKQMLEEDGFIQSVSARGNSQDNAPMESFFGRMKTAILDLVALCGTYEAASRLTEGYLKAYNTEHYQYGLAGLTPEEFYGYATTGIYPLESYFGVSSAEMMEVDDLKKARREYADEEARKRREASAEKREKRRLVDPKKIIRRDQRLLDGMISKWRQLENSAHKQVEHLKGVLDKTKEAMKFVSRLTEEERKNLKEPLNWRKYPELGYVFEMNELF